MKRRAETVKGAEKANKNKLESPFIKYCILTVSCMLLIGVALCFMIFKTDTLISVNLDKANKANNINRISVRTVLAQVAENENENPAEINIPGVPGADDSMYAGVTTPGGGNGLTELIDGWLQLYDGPTVAGEAYEVNIPMEANGHAGGYRGGTWAMGESAGYNRYIRTSYSDQTNNVGPGGIGRINNSGRYWVALGPNVTNQNFQCDDSRAGASAGEWTVDGKRIDVVLRGLADNKLYYLPVVLGDAKAHTSPTGIVQTGRHVHNAEYFAYNDDRSIVEFTFCPARSAASLNSKFEIVKMLVYPADN